MNNICFIHKIALVWSIYRNIFQRMDYAASLVVQLKNVLIFLKHSTIHCAFQDVNSPTFLPKIILLLIVTLSNPTLGDSPLKIGGNSYYRNSFPSKKHFLPTQLLKILGQIIINVIPRTNAVLKMSQLHISYILIIKFIETLTNELKSIIRRRPTVISFIRRNYFTIGHNNRR